MPRLVNATPKYRKHKATGQAIVTIQGKDHYLGPWQSKASKIEYDRLIGEWLAAGRPTDRPGRGLDLTVTELIAAYWKYVKQRYVKDGKPTGEQGCLKLAVHILRDHYGHTSAAEFGPLALKALRSRMIGRATSDIGSGRA